METKRDLVKIGQEAFELLDKFYPPNRTRSSSSSQTYFHQYQSPNPNMVVYKINPNSSQVATSEKMTMIRTHQAEAVEIRGNPVVPRSQYHQVLSHNVHHHMKPAATIVGNNKVEKKSRGGLFLIGGFGRK